MCDCFMDTDTCMTYSGGTSEEDTGVGGWRGLSDRQPQCNVRCAVLGERMGSGEAS